MTPVERHRPLPAQNRDERPLRRHPWETRVQVIQRETHVIPGGQGALTAIRKITTPEPAAPPSSPALEVHVIPGGEGALTAIKKGANPEPVRPPSPPALQAHVIPGGNGAITPAKTYKPHFFPGPTK